MRETSPRRSETQPKTKPVTELRQTPSPNKTGATEIFVSGAALTAGFAILAARSQTDIRFLGWGRKGKHEATKKIEKKTEEGPDGEKHPTKEIKKRKEKSPTDEPAASREKEKLPPPGKLSKEQLQALQAFRDEAIMSRYKDASEAHRRKIQEELGEEPQIEEIKRKLGIGDVRQDIYERLEELRQKENRTDDETKEIRKLREQLKHLDKPEDTSD